MKNIIKYILVISFTLALFSCEEIPAPGSIAPDVKYKNRKQFAISGMQQNIGYFEASSSTLPMKFAIVNIYETSGQDISALTEELPVVQYNSAIVGNETPDELALKTDTVSKPAISVNTFTGQIEIQEGNNIPAGEYHFDIEITNTSGSKVLEDAIVIEFKEYEIASWSRNMVQQPVIERIGDEPHQILFQGFLNGEQLPGNRIDFTQNRSVGFKGTFVNDTSDGEIWEVNFPVDYSNTYCTWSIIETVEGEETISFVSENFDFVLGRPGNYIIKLYK